MIGCYLSCKGTLINVFRKEKVDWKAKENFVNYYATFLSDLSLIYKPCEYVFVKMQVKKPMNKNENDSISRKLSPQIYDRGIRRRLYDRLMFLIATQVSLNSVLTF